MSASYVHGSTDEREIARLEKQAAWTAGFSLPRFDARVGHRVLDLACGVGAMAAQVSARFPGIELVGLDLSAGVDLILSSSVRDRTGARGMAVG